MSRSSGGTSSTPMPRSARPDLMAASMYAWSQLISLIGGSGLRSALSERVRMSWMRSSSLSFLASLILGAPRARRGGRGR